MHTISQAKVYTLFFSKGHGGAGAPPDTLVTNEALLTRLQKRCPEIEFISRDFTGGNITADAAANELESVKDDIDGVLVIGVTRDYRFLFSGLPTIMVYNLFEFMNIPYELFEEREHVLTATLDRIGTTAPEIAEAMFRDLVARIDLFLVLRRLKESRILSISPYRDFHVVDYQGDLRDHLPPGYNRRYAYALDEVLGIDLVKIEPAEFFEAVKNASEAQVREIAATWLQEAQAITDTTKAEVRKTASVYVAFEALRQKYGANAISTHMRRWRPGNDVESLMWPGMAIIEFQKHGIVGVCQDYPNIVAAHLIAQHAVGRPSMLGDLMIDVYNRTDIITHCGAPINPFGSDRVPYLLHSHAESPLRGTGKPGSGTGVQVELPIDEPVTVWKPDVLGRRILLHTGTSTDGRALYKGLNGLMCRTKLVARVDADKVRRHFRPEHTGIHRAVTFGDLRETVRNLCALTGLELIEEDH